MALMRWSENFLTGIEIIDNQHRRLVELVNDSAPTLALTFKCNPEKAGELLNALTDYAVYHFKTESDLMRHHQIDPRHYQHHLGSHADFANSMAAMRALYEQGEAMTGGALLGFLANWLVSHILGEDQSMARQIHAIENGFAPAEAYDSAELRPNATARDELTRALVDLFVLMSEQNQQLQEMNNELHAHREHLEELVATRTRDMELARQAAETANRAKSAFITNLSHEIRTPMNAIVGLTWSLQQESINPEHKGKIQQISQSTQQLLGIINDLIDISRIESAQLSLEFVDFDLRQIIEHIVADLAGKAQKKGLNFSTSLPPKIPALLHGDPVRITQIISNFVSNAIKFTQRGSVHLKVGLEAGDTATQTFLLVAVEDTGIGISPAQRQQLFQPFGQVEQTTRRRFGGAGLGLAINQRLAEMMGGKIGVYSQTGQGSIFWFEVPLTAVNSAITPDPSAHQESDEYPAKINWPEIENTLREMSRLLAEDDIQAISQWRINAGPLKVAFGEEANRLEDELNHYNFETAHLLVQELLGKAAGN